MKPRKHHIVSECYLSEFASKAKKQIQVYDLQFQKVSNPKTPAQVCYEIDRFKIRSEETIKLNRIDEYVVEREFFKKIENNYPVIIEKVKKALIKETWITNNDAKDFLSLLLSIKKRSDDFKNKYLDKSLLSSQMDKNIEEILPVLKQMSEEVVGNNVEEQLKYYKERLLNDDEKLYDSYLLSLKDGKVLNDLIDYLMRFKWMIVVGSVNNQFITSDNPGFTFLISKRKVVNFGGFGYDFMFVFPLTPIHALYIDKNFVEDSDLIVKPLYSYLGRDSYIKFINRCTKISAKKKLFAYSISAFGNI
jgi:hypothetical protein